MRLLAPIRANISTIGVTAGNIVATIIATHTARNSGAPSPIVGAALWCSAPTWITQTHAATVRATSTSRMPTRAREIGVAVTWRHQPTCVALSDGERASSLTDPGRTS